MYDRNLLGRGFDPLRKSDQVLEKSIGLVVSNSPFFFQRWIKMNFLARDWICCSYTGDIIMLMAVWWWQIETFSSIWKISRQHRSLIISILKLSPTVIAWNFRKQYRRYRLYRCCRLKFRSGSKYNAVEWLVFSKIWVDQHLYDEIDNFGVKMEFKYKL